MATVRQLTTRFNFETDKRGLKEFRDGMAGAKAALLGIAGALGVGAVAASLTKAGNDLQRSAVLAKQFTDEVTRLDDGAVSLTGELATAWERVKKAIPGTEVMSDFLNSFVKFRQTFKDAPLEKFETLFTAAGNLARITGKPLADTFDALHNAVVSGDFDALVEFLPEFDKMDANMQNFVRGLTEVDPTRVNNVGQRLTFIVGELDKAIPRLQETAKEMMNTTAEGQWDLLRDNIRRTSEELSGPMHQATVALLKPVNDFFQAWIDGGANLQAFFDAYEQKVGTEMPEILKRSARGLQSFFRDPFGLFENLGIGARSFRGEAAESFRKSQQVDPKRFTEAVLGGREGGITESVIDFFRNMVAGPGADVSMVNRSAKSQPIFPGVSPDVAMVDKNARVLNFSPQIIVSGVTESDLARRIKEELVAAFEDAGRQFVNAEQP